MQKFTVTEKHVAIVVGATSGECFLVTFGEYRQR